MMDKYKSLYDDVYSVFASVAWTAEAIKTIPADVILKGAVTEFVRISIVSSGYGINSNSVSGVLIAEIFTPANLGPLRALTIADKLDKYLSYKSKSTVSGKITQMFVSSLIFNGVDRDNKDLVKSTFSVPFNHFGI